MIMRKYAESKIMLERASKVLAGGVSSEFRKYNHPHALFYKGGVGTKIIDVDGNEYLDFTLSQGPLILGHSHPEVLAAVNSYSDSGQLYAGQHIQEIELAEKICELIPSAELIRFCLDGSEAVQTAFRVARAKTGKNKFLRFEGHYHGWLDNVAWGISTPGIEQLGEESNPNVYPWSKGISAGSRDEFLILPWNNLGLLEVALSRHHQDIAAIITEPVMCNNGCIPPEEGFLEGIRSLCDKYGICMIMDEVITGFRLGLGGAQSFFGITPDLSIFAKAMGSGYPISAIVGKREWMDCIASGEVIHAGTMNSSNPTIAAALATIRVLEKEKPYERMFYLGKKLMNGLRAVGEETKQNLMVSGMGPMFNTFFAVDGLPKDYRGTLYADKGKLSRFVIGLQEEGIRIIGRGLWYISTVHTEAEIEYTLEKARKVLEKL